MTYNYQDKLMALKSAGYCQDAAEFMLSGNFEAAEFSQAVHSGDSATLVKLANKDQTKDMIEGLIDDAIAGKIPGVKARLIPPSGTGFKRR